MRLAFRPAEDRAWYWAALVAAGRHPVVVAAADVALPRRGLEVRAEGLWADHFVETSFDHVSVACEAFALELDDHSVAVDDSTRGAVVPFGLDLGWETVGDVGPVPEPGAAEGCYELVCSVHGEVLVGDEALPVDAPGARAHRWGPEPWSSPWQLGTLPVPGPGAPAGAGVHLVVPARPPGLLEAMLVHHAEGRASWRARFEPGRA